MAAQDHRGRRNREVDAAGIEEMKRWCVAVTAAAALVLVGCSSDPAASPPEQTSTTQPSPPTSTTHESEPAAAPETVEPAPTQEPIAVETIVVQEPVIVDCQPGMGPITTYWSNGSVTGYSDYCQSVHDQALAEEVAANTPVCDGGAVCTYPSGAQVVDPSANQVVIPYTCGYDVLCDEAGNVIPGPESGVMLGNGWMCAGNGCTRP